MISSYHDYFRNHSQFFQRNGLFWQVGLTGHIDFEQCYIALRKKEGRLYDDDTVKSLPLINPAHSLSKEWRMRKGSFEQVSRYFKRRKARSIIEIGCGNGWLANSLSQSLQVPVCGIDVDETELLQAARIFNSQSRLTFVHGDVLTASLVDLRTDIVLLAASIQYFENLGELLRQLLGLLYEGGEVHILDSPLYEETEVVGAQMRSAMYFDQQGFSMMKSWYHHHRWKTLREFNLELLSDPKSLKGGVQRKFSDLSPFPWIKIVL